jgi:hypothetical protein
MTDVMSAHGCHSDPPEAEKNLGRGSPPPRPFAALRVTESHGVEYRDRTVSMSEAARGSQTAP